MMVMRTHRNTIAALALVAALAATAWAENKDDTSAISKPPQGSVASQLQLLNKIRAVQEGTTLAAALDHNRMEWESLSPDQRNRFRKDALAFLSANPQEQEQLVKQYEKLIKLSSEQQLKYRRTAEWLKVVVASYTPEERKQLAEMTPGQRANALLQRKAELIRQGKLPEEMSTSQPASMPATQPTR